MDTLKTLAELGVVGGIAMFIVYKASSDWIPALVESNRKSAEAWASLVPVLERLSATQAEHNSEWISHDEKTTRSIDDIREMSRRISDMISLLNTQESGTKAALESIYKLLKTIDERIAAIYRGELQKKEASGNVGKD